MIGFGGAHCAHIYRAMLEGLAYALRKALNAEQRSGVPITEVRVAGGVRRVTRLPN